MSTVPDWSAFTAPPLASGIVTDVLPDPYGYGQDLSCGADVNGNADLDARGTEAAGQLLFAQELLRRLTTVRGSVPDDSEQGTDARDDLSAGITAADYPNLAAKYSAELGKDDRVLRIDTSILLSTSDTIQVAFWGLALDGPFRFTTSITDAGAIVSEAT